MTLKKAIGMATKERKEHIEYGIYRLVVCQWLHLIGEYKSRQWEGPISSLCDLCTAIRQNRHKPRGFWSAVAERSGDTAFRLRTEIPKRRGASLPAAVQKDLVEAPLRSVLLGLNYLRNFA
jgi:hypothetical protein